MKLNLSATEARLLWSGIMERLTGACFVLEPGHGSIRSRRTRNRARHVIGEKRSKNWKLTQMSGTRRTVEFAEFLTRARGGERGFIIVFFSASPCFATTHSPAGRWIQKAKKKSYGKRRSKKKGNGSLLGASSTDYGERREGKLIIIKNGAERPDEDESQTP